MAKLLSSYKLMILFALSMLILAMPELSFAGAAAADAQNNDIVQILCNVINFITGGIGKAIAIIILISLAISLFLGKVSWGLAIAVAVGMGILFGATTVINAITAGVGNASTTVMCAPVAP